ncbi:hypothetical protein CBR_g31807 [Chara braunii]|uniref:CCHC-type domain-containing protein n=1 Tax=Chara braunii TaxID=69332 RepID=A0A388LFQ5_CHABU|nr:hypothetical protein CBR_g31807 [Chara braunii]|eukprot:GBG81131.1 hypothetical protein CBR_g31807 [Chara braunii]
MELIPYAIKYGKENDDVGLDSESDEDDPSSVRRHSYSATARMFEDRFRLGPAKKGSDRQISSAASTSRRSNQAQGGRDEEEISMKEVAAQLVTVVAPLTEFVQGLQWQRIAAAQRQQAAMAAGSPVIRPAVAGADPPLRCYDCNQPSHLAKDCPKPRPAVGPSRIPLAARAAAGEGRVATVTDTATTEMVTPAAPEIGPDEYMAAAMFKPGTIGVIRNRERGRRYPATIADAIAPRRTYNAVVVPDYIAQHEERVVDFRDEKPLRPPSSYPRPAPPKAPWKTLKRKRRHPSPEAQGSRIDGGEEVVQRVHARSPDPEPARAATLVEEPVVPSPPIPRLPDLNLDGAGPSAAAAAGGSRVGLPHPASRPPSSRDLSASASHPGVLRSLLLAVPSSQTVHPTKLDFRVEPTTIRLKAITGVPRPNPVWEPYLTSPFQGCIAARMIGTLIYETGQRPNAMYHFLIFTALKRERRPYTETHLVMTGPGPRSVRKRVMRAVADLAPRVLSHVPGAFLYPLFVQHHFHEVDAPTTPPAMAAFLPPIPPPLNPDIDHFV